MQISASGAIEVRVAADDSAATPPARLLVVPPAEPAAQVKGVADSPRIVTPSLGRPVFVEPGAAFDALLDRSIAPGESRFELRTSRFGGLRFSVERESPTDSSMASGVVARLRVPAHVPSGTYDLLIHAGSASQVARHCVAVGHVGESIRIVHLSDMNIGDPTAPEFDAGLAAEIDLLAPSVVVTTGDLVDATHPRPATAWQRAADFLASLGAPVIAARGDQDDAESYARHIAVSPIGEVLCGPHRFIVLHDHAQAPLSGDADQVRWIARLLDSPSLGATAFVGHADSTDMSRLLGSVRNTQSPARIETVQAWLVGGHVDGESIERKSGQPDKSALPRVFRTHQSSGATRGGASGRSHYRVIELSRSGAASLGEMTAGQPGDAPSMEIGRLRARITPLGDDAGGPRRIEIVNASDKPAERLRVQFSLSKSGGARPVCPGAEPLEIHDLGDRWLCSAWFRVPDRGAIRTQARCGTVDSPVDEIAIAFDLPGEVALARIDAAGSSPIYAARVPRARVSLSLAGGAPAHAVRPLIRLDGDPIAYRLAGAKSAGPFVTMDTVRVEPGRPTVLELDFSAIRARPGARLLQVTMADRDVQIPATWPMELRSDRREPPGQRSN